MLAFYGDVAAISATYRQRLSTFWPSSFLSTCLHSSIPPFLLYLISIHIYTYLYYSSAPDPIAFFFSNPTYRIHIQYWTFWLFCILMEMRPFALFVSSSFSFPLQLKEFYRSLNLIVKPFRFPKSFPHFLSPCQHFPSSLFKHICA